MGLASKIKSSEAAKHSSPPLPQVPQGQKQDFWQGPAPSPVCAPGGGAEAYPSASHGHHRQHAYASPAQAQLNTPSPYDAYSAPAGPYPFAQQHQRPHGDERQQHHPYGADYAQKQQQPPYGEGYCTRYDGAVQQNYYQQAHTPYQAGMEAHPNSMPPTSNNMDMLAKKLQLILQTHGLQRFYDPRRYQTVLDKLSRIDFAEISAQWKIGKELAYDLAPLILHDIVFYCDDSGSMAFEENGERIEDLKFILSKVSGIATLFDDDGITVRFMNSNVNGDGIRNPADVSQLISQVRFSGVTPLGTNFERKVIQPLVLGQALGNASMAKPVLAILITDGEPYGEKKDAIVQVIRRAKDALAKSPYGSGALAVQIAQVGKDAKTQKFLEALDKDPFVGGIIDCTSYYEMEEEEFARKGVTLTPELWLLKMCVGAIDPEYDTQDD
ncbi:hypothetical protein KP509_22G063200 [Ceratopteris richardii]|uniref:VWFA domain-containing protein n=1 Tax=Ceratopteris richardii TaxID=49495 RepID=A0A8T2S8P5_CERRI|nr:hypothetical protein KP509_22G063200 [Ceratopteris richardii]